jgi:hypothetical protein
MGDGGTMRRLTNRPMTRASGALHHFLTPSLATIIGAFMITSALAAFSGRTLVSPANQAAFLASAGVDADGDVLYGWDDFLTGRIAIRAKAAAGAFGAATFISPAGERASAPQVVVAPNGRALILWLVNDTSSQRIRGRTRAAAGALGPVQTFATGTTLSSLSVKMDGDGDAYAVWTNGDHLVQLRTLSKTNVLGPIQQIAAHATDSFSNAQIAVAPNGLLQIAWLRSVGGNDRIEARTRTAAGALLVTNTVTGPTPKPIGISVAINSAGRALIVWMESNKTIRARTRASGGTLGAKTLIGTADQTLTFGVTSDAAGNAVIMWNATNGINVRPLSAAGATGTVKQLVATDNSSGVGLATLKNGSTVFLWMTVAQSPTRVQVFARQRLKNGGYTLQQTLSPVIPNTTIPFLAAGPEGDVVALWIRNVNSAFRLETILGP